MNTRKMILGSLLMFGLAALLLPGCKNKGGAGTAAAPGDVVWIKVNGKSIMKSRVEEEMSRFRQQLSSQMPEEQLATMEMMIKHDAMQRAVQAEVLMQHADAENIVVDEAKVAEEFKKLKTQFPNEEAFQARLKELKLTEAELQAELKKSLRFQQLLEAKVQVPDPTEEEIKGVYEKAKERLLEPAKATVYSIFLSVPTTATADEKSKRKATADDVLKQLQGGGDFKALATQYSEAASKAEGGKETLTKGAQVKELDDVIFAMKPGDLSNVIETPQGFYIVKLEEITPEKTPTLDEVRAEIIQFLKEGQQKDKMQAYVEGLVKEAKVEYIEPLPDMSQQGMPGMGGMPGGGMPPGHGEGGMPPHGGEGAEPPPAGAEGAPPSGELPPGHPPVSPGEAPPAPPASPEAAPPAVPAPGAPATP